MASLQRSSKGCLSAVLAAMSKRYRRRLTYNTDRDESALSMELQTKFGYPDIVTRGKHKR